MSEMHPEIHERRILGTELLWAVGVGILIAATLSTIVFTALTRDLSDSGRLFRGSRPRDQAAAGSYRCEGIRYGNVGAADQPRPEADRIDARNSSGSGVGPALGLHFRKSPPLASISM